MSRRSVREFVISAVLGLVSDLTVTKQIPKEAPMGDFACILRMESHEHRVSGGRGAGYAKEVEHKVYLMVGNADADESGATDHHDDLIQVIIATMRAYPLFNNAAVNLLDATANPPEASVIKYIGEQMDVTQDRIEQMQSITGAESQIMAVSTLVATVVERVSG